MQNPVHVKGYLHLCPRMYFLYTLHINNSTYTNYENRFIELNSLKKAKEAALTYSNCEVIPVSKFLRTKSIVLFISKICHLD